MKIQIEKARKVGDGVWEVMLDPAEVRMLGSCSCSYLETSVLIVEDLASVSNSTGNVLTIDPKSIYVLNIGNSSRTLILEEHKKIADPDDKSAVVSNEGFAAKKFEFGGDAQFIRNLPSSLKELGQSLLGLIRQHFIGELNITESGKFVESPKNFWTVKIQPRDNSLAITVKGRPHTFSSSKLFELKDDRPGYSRFKLTRKDQLADVISIIRQASSK